MHANHDSPLAREGLLKFRSPNRLSSSGRIIIVSPIHRKCPAVVLVAVDKIAKRCEQATVSEGRRRFGDAPAHAARRRGIGGRSAITLVERKPRPDYGDGITAMPLRQASNTTTTQYLNCNPGDTPMKFWLRVISAKSFILLVQLGGFEPPTS